MYSSSNNHISTLKIADECCICLGDDYTLSKKIYMKCCNQILHQRCLFDISIYGHKNCPLCREKLKLKNYFTRNEFKKYIYDLNIYEKCNHAYHIQNALHELTYIPFLYRSMTDYIIYILSRIVNFIYNCSISYFPYILLTIIIVVFFILTTLLIKPSLGNQKEFFLLDLYY